MIYLVGTADTKAEEIVYLRELLSAGTGVVCSVDIGTRDPKCSMDIPATEVARHHPDGAGAVLDRDDRGTAVAGMGQAFTLFCAQERPRISAMVGIGGGGGTSIISEGMRSLPLGLPKLIVSTLASGDVAPFVGTSDIIMMPAITDLAGLNRISRHVLHNAAQAVLGMARHPYQSPQAERRAIGLSMFGVTTPAVTQAAEHLRERFECVIFHATGTGGQIMERLLAEGQVDALLDLTTTEVADEIVGGVLSAGSGRLDAVVESAKPYVGSVGAVDMVNFWAPDTIPARFSGRLFYNHNSNVTLMRTTPEENREIGRWIGAKLNHAKGQVRMLLPEKGLSALDIEGGPFHNPEASRALFDAIEESLMQTDSHQVIRLPLHINDLSFSRAAADCLLELMQDSP